MAVRYISPTGAGLMDGSSAANAGTLASLSKLIAAAGPGGEVRLLADQGAYHPSGQISVSAGGTEAAPVTIRGVDHAGHDMAANISGTRPVHWTTGQSEGTELFRLLNGADNLRFEHLSVHNVGNGAFRIGADINNLTIEHVDAHNVYRFIGNNVSGTETSATVSGLTVRDVDITGYARGAILLKYDSHGIVIEDLTASGPTKTSEPYIGGVVLDGTAHDILLRNVEISNNRAAGTADSYWNGDGFTTERGVHDVRFENTVSRGNTDAGYDIKSSNTVLVGAVAEDNNRSFRFWSDSVTLENGTSITPTHSGGIAGTAHVWLGANAKAILDNFHFTDGATHHTLFDLSQGGAVLTLSDTVIPAAYTDLVWLLKGSHLETVVRAADNTPHNDVINGTAGADTLHGYAGNDSYLVNSSRDIVVEGASAGVDSVTTSLAKYNLTANVENLTHLGNDDFVGVGNLLNNKMVGGSGADEFHGGKGHDTLIAGTGSDLLFGDSGSDVLFGNAGYDKLHGGGDDDRLSGGNGSDRLYGENGNDTLSGGNGLDKLFGGDGNDSFVFDTAPRAGNVDVIHDFNAAADTIRLDDVVFDDIHATGQLAAGAFAHWQDPGQTNDRIIYDQNSGKLYYDPTGGAHADAQQFATLTNAPDDLGAKDFIIF